MTIYRWWGERQIILYRRHEKFEHYWSKRIECKGDDIEKKKWFCFI